VITLLSSVLGIRHIAGFSSFFTVSSHWDSSQWEVVLVLEETQWGLREGIKLLIGESVGVPILPGVSLSTQAT
jgi:hypothetical protein